VTSEMMEVSCRLYNVFSFAVCLLSVCCCCRHLARSVVFSRSITTTTWRLKFVVLRGHTIQWQSQRWLRLTARLLEVHQEVKRLQAFGLWTQINYKFTEFFSATVLPHIIEIGQHLTK